MLDQRITLNATGTGEKAVVRMVYGDTGRRIIASFEDYTIPAGSTAEISFERPNGTLYMVPGTITGQDVSFETDQMTTETGYTVATLTVTETDGRVSSFPFYCFVAKCADGSPLTPEEAISLVILAAKVEVLEAAVQALQNKFPIGTTDIQDGAVTPEKLTESYVPKTWLNGTEPVDGDLKMTADKHDVNIRATFDYDEMDGGDATLYGEMSVKVQAQEGDATVEASYDAVLRSNNGNAKVQAAGNATVEAGGGDVSIYSDIGDANIEAPEGTVNLNGQNIKANGYEIATQAYVDTVVTQVINTPI